MLRAAASVKISLWHCTDHPQWQIRRGVCILSHTCECRESSTILRFQ